MPLKLNVAISRKIGQPNYGSRGATVGLELDIDAELIEKPRQLHAQISRLFRLARASVDRELDIDEFARLPRDRRATPAQLRALRAIARKRQVDLTAELNRRFDVSSPSDLTIEQASRLIGGAWQVNEGYQRNGSAN
jgi:hypothetical protein